jgi:hypothetical protein
MGQIEEVDPQASNDGISNDYEDSSEPQAKRFRPDFEDSNDFNQENPMNAQPATPWENPPPGFNNNNKKGSRGGSRQRGSRWR